MTDEQQAIAVQYRGLASNLAQRFHRRTGLEYEELHSEATLHLVAVAKWFDFSRGKPFAPIAARCISQRLNYWVKKQLRIRGCVLSSETGKVDCVGREPMPDNRMRSREEVEQMRRLVPEEDWKILWEVYANGKTPDEAANDLGCNRLHVSLRVRIAVQCLRNKLKRMGKWQHS